MLRTRGRSKRTRRAVVAALALAGLPLLIAGWSASAAVVPLPTLPIPTPSISLPIPTPTPTVSLPIQTPKVPLPPITVPALPVQLPSPLSGGLPGLPGVPGSGLPVTGAPGVSGSGLPLTGLPGLFQPPGSPYLPGGVTGTSGDGSGAAPPDTQASVLGALLGLLGTPAGVGVEQPSLEHFEIGTSVAADKLASANPGGGGRGGGPPALLWGLVIAGLLAVLAGAIARRHQRRLSRGRAVAAAPLIVLVALITVAAARSTWFPSTPANTATAIVVADTASRSAPTAAAELSTGSALFNRLVGFEAQIAQTETEMDSPPDGQGAALLDEEHQLATSLQATLQQEYAFFATTARNPAQAAALVQASANQPAKVRAVVWYDVQAVQAQLAQQAAITQAAARNSTVSLPVGAGPALAPSGTPGALHWPMSGVVTQGFGPSRYSIEPALTFAGVTYPHFHTGIDIASAYGTPVQAAANGVVALAGAETDGLGHLVGYGNYVVIAHGGNMITLYGHLEQVLVHVGQTVGQGDPIGLEGSSGNSTGPHVHFELRINGIVTDPTMYVAPS